MPEPPEVPLVYQRRIRDLLIQALYVAVTALVIAYVVLQLGGREYGFGFLNQPASFDVGNQWLTNIDGTTNSRFTMYLVGVWSTIRVVVLAIALSTVFGILIASPALLQLAGLAAGDALRRDLPQRPALRADRALVRGRPLRPAPPFKT